MTSRVAVLPAIALSLTSLITGAPAAAAPPLDAPDGGAYAALDALAADGLLPGYPDRNLHGDAPATRYDLALLVKRALSRVRVLGPSHVATDDLARLQTLVRLLKGELDFVGVPVAEAEADLQPSPTPHAFVRTTDVHGSVLPNESFRQRTVSPHAIGGGAVDPFVNAFLTSPADNSPFEHEPGPGNLLLFDDQLDFTYAFAPNLSLAVQTRITPNVATYTQQEQYTVQPAVRLNVARAGALDDGFVRIGELEGLPSSRLGLTYRAPDATQQGPGWQNPVQPYETGIALGGTLDRYTRFGLSIAQVDQSLVDTSVNDAGGTGATALKNYFLVDVPAPSSLVQYGAPGTTAPTSAHTDTYVASNGPIASVPLRSKAGVGTVYVSAINGTVCTPAGDTPAGGPCPIARNQWYFIDQLNTVVFASPLPVGSVVQISYAGPTSAGGDRYADQYSRYHILARLDQEIAGLPGAELGFSYSRLFDDVGGTRATLPFGNGFGALSDTVLGFDARVPLTFAGSPQHRAALFGEGATSKYTPDAFHTAAVTDSAYVLGLRVPLGALRFTAQYQHVGADFFDGGPLRFEGPPPTTYGFARDDYFPQFFGFENTLAINRIFQHTVTPGCAGSACVTRNPLTTYIFPVFNPFVASGPQFFSAYAPNTRGFSGDLTVPLRRGERGVEARLAAQHLSEIVPNAIGQQRYGPGFASGTAMKFDKFEAGVKGSTTVARRMLTLAVNATEEHLVRNDRTAYAYTPFNTDSGAADAASAAALNAYLAGGATPVLFYPNFVDVRHFTLGLSAGVPLTRDLGFGLGYDAQMFHGSDGLTLAQSMSQYKNDAYASVRYAIPQTTSSLGVTYANAKYRDFVLPSYDFNQNRQTIDFISRF